MKLIGLPHAKRLVMTGEMIGANDALEIGLVEEVVASEALMDHAMAFARRLAAKAPMAIGLAKLVLNQCANVDPETGRNFERLVQSILKKSEDHIEGARAFIEKRAPDFKGT